MFPLALLTNTTLKNDKPFLDKKPDAQNILSASGVYSPPL